MSKRLQWDQNSDKSRLFSSEIKSTSQAGNDQDLSSPSQFEHRDFDEQSLNVHSIDTSQQDID